jgi:hypothetical protein
MSTHDTQLDDRAPYGADMLAALEDCQYAMQSVARQPGLVCEITLVEGGQLLGLYAWRTTTSPDDALDDLVAILERAADPSAVEVYYEYVW